MGLICLDIIVITDLNNDVAQTRCQMLTYLKRFKLRILYLIKHISQWGDN